MSKTSGMKKIMALCLFIFGMTFLAGCGKQVIIKKRPETTGPTKSQPAATIDTANWQTYSFSQYGFEFKYPPNYSVSTDERRDIKLFINNNYEFWVQIIDFKLQPVYYYPPAGEMVELKEVPIGTQKWYEWTPGDGGGMSVLSYKTAIGDQTLDVTFPNYRTGWMDRPGDNEKYSNALYQDIQMHKTILSTFTFTK